MPPEKALPKDGEKPRVCPKCGSVMAQGEMQGGSSHGRRAWACTNYPKCGHIEIEQTRYEKAMLDALLREGRRKSR